MANNETGLRFDRYKVLHVQSAQNLTYCFKLISYQYCKKGRVWSLKSPINRNQQFFLTICSIYFDDFTSQVVFWQEDSSKQSNCLTCKAWSPLSFGDRYRYTPQYIHVLLEYFVKKTYTLKKTGNITIFLFVQNCWLTYG